jgi:hypothetical protein
MTSDSPAAALRTLAILLTILALLPLAEIPLTGFVTRPIAMAIFAAIALSALFHYIQKGSSTARVLLTILAGLGLLGGAIYLFFAARIPSLAAFYGVGFFLRVAAIILVNTAPINSLSDETPSAPKARPVSGTHEHDWQPHALLNDWLQCSACGEMHAESGTVALINRKN